MRFRIIFVIGRNFFLEKEAFCLGLPYSRNARRVDELAINYPFFGVNEERNLCY